jgi:DTW domain-containing protein YfiP
VTELVTTRARVLLFQHPRERRVPIGTARLAHLGLPGSVLRTGLDFSDDPILRSALVGPCPTFVLFPGPTAVPLEALPKDTVMNLVVIDGTWWQARKLLRLNPILANLPRVGFVPRTPSQYRIRTQPASDCVSTIEALAEVLRAIEPDGDRFKRLLDPFRAMVDHQIRFEAEVSTTRHKRVRRKRKPSLGERLAAVRARLVLVQGEANSWPMRHPDRQPAELVHWEATRLGTPERFSALMAPQRPLAPSTPRYLRLPPERFAAGEAPAAARERWRRFLRPDDVLLAWGPYHLGLARAADWTLPPEITDLRSALSQQLKRRTGTIEEALGALAVGSPLPCGEGRAALRLSALGALVQHLMSRF